ncbi:MAG: phenylalanine--tRNA ligase subunit beta, partial [Chloroflexota bacterium]|nr:phenylalanine--tRNA ligase subunit beta [Chloroflexota bacterium]
MKAPLPWLAEYAPLRGSSDEIAHRLTMQGIETTYMPGPAAGWDGIVVGRVVELEPHPNADRLRLATVDLGADAKRVVCGAPNIAVGQRIAFAGVGVELVNGHTGERMTLTAATIRGVRSEGMVCSERELGLSDDHEGILVLPDDAPIGAPLADCIPAGDAFEVEVTANRGDCLSMLGVAREIAAGNGDRVTEPSTAYDESATPNPVKVEIHDPALCARYTASVIRGVRVAPSPAWLRRRLEAAGQRPINNVVDVTNYVMLEYGQPLHAFDMSEVGEQTVVVRQAAPGERLVTLDGVERALAPPMLVIADPQRAIALAGVMG